MSKYSALCIVFLTSISCLNAMEEVNAKNMKLAELRDLAKKKNAEKKVNVKNMKLYELKDLINKLESLNVASPFCDKDSINNTKKITYNLDQPTENISAACFSPNRVYCSLGSSDGSTYIYNLNDGKLIKRMEANEPVTALCWSHDSRYLIVGFKKGLLGFYDVKSKKSAATFSCAEDVDAIKEIPEELREISSLYMSPFSEFLVVGLASGTIVVLETRTAVMNHNWNTVMCKCTIQGHKGRITSLCFNIDDKAKQLLASCAGKKIKIWDFDQIEGKDLSYSKFTDTADVLSICFSPDGKSIASGYADNTIKIWSLDKNKKGEFIDYGKPLCTISGHSDAVSSVQYNSNGKLLLSGSYDKEVKLWDMEQPEKPENLKTFEMQSEICHLHLSGDDTYILVGLKDKTISIITFIKDNIEAQASNILLAERNMETSLLTIFPSFSIITQLLLALSMKKEAALQHLLSEIKYSIKYT